MILIKQWLGLGLFGQCERGCGAFAAVLIGLGSRGASTLVRHSRLCSACKGKTKGCSNKNQNSTLQITNRKHILLMIGQAALSPSNTSSGIIIIIIIVIGSSTAPAVWCRESQVWYAT